MLCGNILKINNSLVANKLVLYGEISQNKQQWGTTISDFRVIMNTMHSCNFGVAGVEQTLQSTHTHIYIFYVYSANAGPDTLVEIVEKKLTNASAVLVKTEENVQMSLQDTTVNVQEDIMDQDVNQTLTVSSCLFTIFLKSVL